MIKTAKVNVQTVGVGITVQTTHNVVYTLNWTSLSDFLSWVFFSSKKVNQLPTNLQLDTVTSELYTLDDTNVPTTVMKVKVSMH